MRARPLALYLVVTGLVVGAIALDTVYLGVGDAVVAARIDGWRQRVAHGEELLEAGRLDEAAFWLEQLDRTFPARHAKHALDTEREKLLLCLGRTYRAQGREKAARSALEKLVEFDPRNYQNHRHLAECLIEQGRVADAEAALRDALAIHPTDLGTTGMLIRLLAEGHRHADVIDAFRRYVDAVAIADVTVDHRGRRVVVPVPVDGLLHEARVALSGPPGSTNPIALHTDGPALEVGTCLAEPPLRAGKPRPEATPIEPDQWNAIPDGGLRTPSPPSGVATLVLRVRVSAPIGALTLGLVERSFAAENARDELVALRGRLQPMAGGSK